MKSAADREATCKLLTAKQHAALDLLSKHMTSKEISRALNISPHTVDQRIEAAKRRLGMASRRELAQAYNAWKEKCQQMTYEDSPIDTSTIQETELIPDVHQLIDLSIDPNRPNVDSDHAKIVDYSVVPEQLDGRNGTLIRFLAIFGFALAIALVALATITIYMNLSDLLDR